MLRVAKVLKNDVGLKDPQRDRTVDPMYLEAVSIYLALLSQSVSFRPMTSKLGWAARPPRFPRIASELSACRCSLVLRSRWGFARVQSCSSAERPTSPLQARGSSPRRSGSLELIIWTEAALYHGRVSSALRVWCAMDSTPQGLR